MLRSVIYTLTLLIPLGVASCGNVPDSPSGSSAPPDLTSPAPIQPELFGSGFVSTQNGERDLTFMPDLSAFYYTLWTGRFGVILEVRRDGDGWSEPSVASFSGVYSDLEPFVTPDGARLFFASNRPLDAGGEPKDYDLWYAEREGGGWSAPTRLSDSVNTAANEFYPSLDEAGTLYFTASYDNSVGGEDIWLVRPEDGRYVTVENAGQGVNTERDEFNAMISPDGSLLTFSSFRREDDLGGGDLYVSMRGPDGLLGPGIHLEAPLNSDALDFSPALSPDGQTFYFSSRRTAVTTPHTPAWTYPELAEGLNNAANGDLDIYRVSASFLRTLKAEQ